MTSSEDDDGRNGPRPFSQSPAPPAMSPLTPATRSAAASVVHENEDHTQDAANLPLPDMEAGSRDPNSDAQMQHDLDVPPLTAVSDPSATAVAPAPVNMASSVDTATTTAPGQSTAFAPATPLDLLMQHSGIPPMNPLTNNMTLMMALAQLSASQQLASMPSAPATVKPAEVSLSNIMHDTGSSLAPENGSEMAAPPTAPAPLESFARIEFADSVFQMTTYEVIIGRDQRALEQARRDERRAEEYQRTVEEYKAVGLPVPSPPSQPLGKFSKSYVSEEGGMLGPESDGDDNPRHTKRRKTGAGGSSGSGNSQQQRDVMTEKQAGTETENNVIANRQYVSHTPGAAVVDLASLRPSPYHVPFIGIHSPGPNIASKTKAISREHLKISFNQKEGIFEAIPLHKNGFFCDDVHYKEGRAILHSGDRLQIKDIEFNFIINGVAPGKTGAEEYAGEDEKTRLRHSEGGKEMSFDFESSHAGEIPSTSSDEEEVDNLADLAQDDSQSELSDVGEEEIMDVDESQVLQTVETDTPPPPPPPKAPASGETQELTDELMQLRQLQMLQELQERGQHIKDEPMMLDLDGLPVLPPKKRGPGRPPKNGIMSKREERLLKKMAAEAQKKTNPDPPPGEPPIKRKVGRPRKHPRPEDDPERPEKRKYKPRKPKGEDGELSDGGDKPPKEKRREKPKTPPLELRKEDFTEEQLQKPNKNYGVLIDEVLTEAAGDGLTLKQIYKRIQKKYPYYYFVVDTKGWESSVRHNLIGNDAFKKNEETHLWSRVPGIELDAGKKRKVPSPDQGHAQLHHGYGQHYQEQMPHPGMYHQQQHMMQQQAYQPNTMPPPGYPPNVNNPPQQQQATSPSQLQYNGMPQAGVPNQQQQQQPRQSYQAQPVAPGLSQQPAYTQTQPPRPMQPGAQGQPPAYSSPYAAKPALAQAPPTNGVPTATQPLQHAQQQQQLHQQPPQTQQLSPQPQQLQQQHQQPGSAVPQYNNTTQQPRPTQYQPLQQMPAAQAQTQPHAPAPGHPQAQMPQQPQALPQQQQSHTQAQAQVNQARPPPPPQQRPTATPLTAPLEPPVRPDVVSFINNFKKNVMEHLTKRTDKAEAVTLSVINRGLGLTDASTVPEQEGIEKVVLGVFEQTRDKAYPTNVLNPGLVTVLKAFKSKWVDTLGGNLGRAKAEALLLSAIDRYLGFSQGTILAGNEKEKKEYEQAEDMLIPQLRAEVTAWQRVNVGGNANANAHLAAGR